MPPGKIRVIFFVILSIFCASITVNAQSNLNQWLADSADVVETTTFRIDNYDVISSIYVFLTSEDERRYWLVLSLEPVETGGGENVPLPCSLDSLFRRAIYSGLSSGSLPGSEQNPPVCIQVHSIVETGENASLLSLLPDDANLKVWTYSIVCPTGTITATHCGYRDEPETWQ